MRKDRYSISKYVQLLIIVGLTACGDSDEPSVKSCDLITASSTSEHSTTFITYTYDQNRLTRVKTAQNEGSTYSLDDAGLSYDDQGRIVTSMSAASTSTFAYEGDNLVKIEAISSTGVKTLRLEIDYVGTRISKIQRSFFDGVNLFKGDWDIYEYSTATGNDPSTITYYQTNGAAPSVVRFEYESYPTPFSNLPEPFRKIIRVFGTGVDRALKKRTSSNSTVEYSYELNQDGFPDKVTETRSWEEADPITTIYRYDCK